MNSGNKNRLKFLATIKVYGVNVSICDRKGMYDNSSTSIDEIPGDVGEMEKLSACRLMQVSVNKVLDIPEELT